jgi:hypothetical protein
MMLESGDGTLVRGADGVLYVVSADTCQGVRDDPGKECNFDQVSEDVWRIAGEHDHASARAMIDPGDHASARAMIDPGDHAMA